jgi:hypothetical protein
VGIGLTWPFARQRDSYACRIEVGAYGLRLPGLASTRLLAAASPSWPALEIRRNIGSRELFPAKFDDQVAEVPLLGNGALTVERNPLRATFLTPEPLGDEEMVHPYLAPAAALASQWLGRETFHAGCVAVNGEAWAVVGERGHGKSSVLASLALQGYQVLSDDLLVVDDGMVFSGPRSIDLRRETAERLSAGTWLGVIGARERWRLELDSVPGSLPLQGWIFLEWGTSIRFDPLPAADRLKLLLRQQSVQQPSPNQLALLDLLSRPAWRLSRPQGWDSMNGSLELLLSHIA